jgi:prepilin-type N-terminal cleavage/methylation domain-containing protein
MRKRGFTLIELLVVIAIIAVLMAILMPSLRIAREQGRSIVCRSNVKTLTLAWLMYKDENDAKLCNAETPGGSYDEKTMAPWVVMPPNTGDSSLEEKKEYIKRGVLWPYVKQVNAYRCPSDRRQKSPFHKYAFRTFSIAGGLNGVGVNGGWEILPCLRYSEIKSPATKYVFTTECDPRGYNMNSWVIRPKSRRWVDPFATWHRRNSSTLGWADGHVDTHRWLGEGLIKWNEQALYEPAGFSFNRTPDSDDEWKDFDFALKGYAYRALQ